MYRNILYADIPSKITQRIQPDLKKLVRLKILSFFF